MSIALDLPWKGDFYLDDRGRFATVDGDTAYVQRLIRRILTTPRLFDGHGNPAINADYLSSPTFGAGSRRLIHTALNRNEVERIITNQILLDPETSKKTKPRIEMTTAADGTVHVAIVAVRAPNISLAFGLRVSA